MVDDGVALGRNLAHERLDLRAGERNAAGIGQIAQAAAELRQLVGIGRPHAGALHEGIAQLAQVAPRGEVRPQVDARELPVRRDRVGDRVSRPGSKLRGLGFEPPPGCGGVVDRVAGAHRGLVQELVEVAQLHARIALEVLAKELVDEFHARAPERSWQPV